MEITDKHIEQFLAAAHQTGERRLTRCMPAPLPLFYFARGKDGSRLRASGRIL